jgi:hypothetical protein
MKGERELHFMGICDARDATLRDIYQKKKKKKRKNVLFDIHEEMSKA